MNRPFTNSHLCIVLSFLLSRKSMVAALSCPLPISLLSADSSLMLTPRRSSRARHPARATLRPPTREVATVTPALPAAAAAATARVTALTTLSPLLVSTTSFWVCQSLLAWLSCGKKSKGMIVGNLASISVLSDVFCFLLANTLWFYQPLPGHGCTTLVRGTNART